MRLLVTGGAGYIGSVVATLLLDAGHRVTVLDDLSTGHRDAVPAGAELVVGGLEKADTVLASGDDGPDDAPYDGVLHFAARSLVSESVAHPERYWRTNVCGTLGLLDAIRRHRVPRLVFSSTAATYGEPEQMPITEDTPARPVNPYGASKLAVDQMLTGEAAAHGLAAISLRYFNVAGALGDLAERHDPETHLIPNLLRGAGEAAEPVRIFGTDYPTRDGTAIRDYLHVVDLADAHLRALDATEAGAHRIFNLGTGNGSSVLEVLSAVREVTGHPVPAVECPRRPGDPPQLVASAGRAVAELGWRPQRTLADMVRDAHHAMSFHRAGGGR